MRKPANPGPDPDIRLDVIGGARSPKPRHDDRRVRDEGEPGVTNLDGSADEANLNDAWLVELARRGDHQAFAVLVHRYERKLIRVLIRLVREPEQARDLAQETFWRVYARLDRFDTARRFGPWLFRVAINLGLDWLRGSRSVPPPAVSIDRAGEDGEEKFELPDPDPRIQADLVQEVHFVLALMPVSYRTILVLRDLEGFSASEVAAIVGRREATVRWRLAKAREKFREIWERRQNDGRGVARDGKTKHGQVDG